MTHPRTSSQVYESTGKMTLLEVHVNPSNACRTNPSFTLLGDMLTGIMFRVNIYSHLRYMVRNVHSSVGYDEAILLTETGYKSQCTQLKVELPHGLDIFVRLESLLCLS